ncbi:MAG: flagellin, partial [Oribacterium sp.]|nr:flagellin [Oribacterium sp.]
QSNVEDIKHAIDKVSEFRARLGAQQNRLEHTRASNEVMDENVISSESRIRDTDIAKEKSKLDKNSILIQSAQNILGQIDKTTQGILQLFG